VTVTESDPGLAVLRVVDFSSQIAGPYCSKLLLDGGAEVVKVEPGEGDSLRHWSATDAPLGDRDSALFSFLNAGKQSVVGRASDPHVVALIAEADLVIAAHGLATDNGERVDTALLCAEHPALVALSITPYGLTGPWADRTATEFTLQAESGSLGNRGLAGEEPFQAGGRVTEWAAGVYAAAAVLPALFRARATRRGEHVDLSLLETANTVFANFSITMNRLINGTTGVPEHAFLAPTVETPSVEPAADGYVGFCTNTREQFSNFLLMIDRADLVDDEELAQFAGRRARFNEWNQIVHEWTSVRSADAIVELASAFRIPVSTVGTGETVLQHEHLVARGVYGRDAEDRFWRPRRPYLIDDEAPARPGPAPTLDATRRDVRFTTRDDAEPRGDDGALPLAGLRVLDVTGWWAGPSAAHILAALGAEVVHVESTSRPDGVRLVGGMMAAHYPQWWEASPHFMHVNTDKLGITLDLSHPKGFALLERLIGWCDAMLENFTPRVLENFGLTWERVQELNPSAVLMRMPAFGLSGPWRDHPGFAQTMEQLSGMAWITGHARDQPRIPRGPCDPIAGMHAAVALLVALGRRRRTGRGHLVESTMAESALNIAAEQVVEWSAYGRLLERDGNRSPLAAPQGLYPCRGGDAPTDRWLAVSVASDEQWRALRSALGEPDWARNPTLNTLAGRRAAHDAIDAHVCGWTGDRDQGDLVAELRARGITASAVADPSRLAETNPQFGARTYFETPEHPVVGPMPLPGLPFRYGSIDRWLRTPAPTLGQDNERVLCGVLGLTADDLVELESEHVIGTRPRGLPEDSE